MFDSLAKNLPRRAALALAAALMVSGCSTIGPDFVAPKPAEGAAFRHAEAAPADNARLPANWWTVFNDATLGELEARALRDSPGAKAAAQRLLQAQAQLGVVRAGQAPNVSVNAGVSTAFGATKLGPMVEQPLTIRASAAVTPTDRTRCGNIRAKESNIVFLISSC